MQTTTPFQLRRLGVIMRGDPHNTDEALGVLNPATARAPDSMADAAIGVARLDLPEQLGVR